MHLTRGERPRSDLFFASIKKSRVRDTCLTSLIKDSESLHSALVVKSDICGKKQFFE